MSAPPSPMMSPPRETGSRRSSGSKTQEIAAVVKWDEAGHQSRERAQRELLVDEPDAVADDDPADAPADVRHDVAASARTPRLC